MSFSATPFTSGSISAVRFWSRSQRARSCTVPRFSGASFSSCFSRWSASSAGPRRRRKSIYGANWAGDGRPWSTSVRYCFRASAGLSCNSSIRASSRDTAGIGRLASASASNAWQMPAALLRFSATSRRVNERAWAKRSTTEAVSPGDCSSNFWASSHSSSPPRATRTSARRRRRRVVLSSRCRGAAARPPPRRPDRCCRGEIQPAASARPDRSLAASTAFR